MGQGMQRVVYVLCNLAAGGAFFTLWFWLLQRWFGLRTQVVSISGLRWLAATLSVLGFSVALHCVWDFARAGRGSPAPFAPPKRLVVVGFYRHVRNPIYVGATAGWIGLWILLRHMNWMEIGATVAAMLSVHAFVVLYEEPTLRKKFGADYEEYCRNVRRWWPRLRGWQRTR